LASAVSSASARRILWKYNDTIVTANATRTTMLIVWNHVRPSGPRGVAATSGGSRLISRRNQSSAISRGARRSARARRVLAPLSNCAMLAATCCITV
jgi:ABC-type Fe3+ transport system permease subunit